MRILLGITLMLGVADLGMGGASGQADLRARHLLRNAVDGGFGGWRVSGHAIDCRCITRQGAAST